MSGRIARSARRITPATAAPPEEQSRRTGVIGPRWPPWKTACKESWYRDCDIGCINYIEYVNETARSYSSVKREETAAATRNRVLNSANDLFGERGIDAVTIAQLAAHAEVSPSTIYGSFKSKEGVLRALIERTFFGGRYQAAAARLEEDPDPVRQIIGTASVARAIYESRAAELAICERYLGILPGPASAGAQLRGASAGIAARTHRAPVRCGQRERGLIDRRGAPSSLDVYQRRCVPTACRGRRLDSRPV